MLPWQSTQTGSKPGLHPPEVYFFLGEAVSTHGVINARCCGAWITFAMHTLRVSVLYLPCDNRNATYVEKRPPILLYMYGTLCAFQGAHLSLQIAWPERRSKCLGKFVINGQSLDPEHSELGRNHLTVMRKCACMLAVHACLPLTAPGMTVGNPMRTCNHIFSCNSLRLNGPIWTIDIWR